jgi:hypothetical protein
MSLLTERKQLALAVETVEGTAETLTTSDLVTALNVTPNINLNPVRRPVQRGTFTKSISGVGIQDGGVTYDIEFAGPGDGSAATASPIGTSMRASGMREVELYAVRISGSFTGDRVVVGDLLVSDSTTSTVRVMATMSKDSYDDGAGANNTHSDILFFEQVSGSGIAIGDSFLVAANTGLSAATLSHGGGTPTLPLSSQTATRVGTAWVPTSSQTKKLTISTPSGAFFVGEIISQEIDAGGLDMAYGRVVSYAATEIEYVPFDGSGFGFLATATPPSVITGASSGETATVDAIPVSAQTPTLTAGTFEDGIQKVFSGCRGATTINLPTGEFPLLNVALQGAYGSVADGANLAEGGTTGAIVPTYLGTEMRVDRVWLPCTSAIAIVMGQNIVRRTCAGNASGLEGFAITDRTPTMTMDPEAVQEAVFASYGNAKLATAFPIQIRFGNFSSGSGVDAWLISMDQCQYESLNQGDRDGIMTHDGALQVNGYETVNESEVSVLNYSYALVNAL